MRKLFIFALLLASVAAFGQGTCGNFVATTCPASVPAGTTAFYFIDPVGGADTNAGTSEGAAWQHPPGSANATNTAAAHTPGVGEGWIFKGGVSLTSAAYPMNVPWGGTSGHPDYMGPDPGWFTGGSWTRPIFDGGGSSGYDSSTRSLITDIAHRSNYVVIDNIEVKGIYFGAACSNSGPYTCGAISQYAYAGTDVNWEFKNVYVHGITHCSFAGACADPGNNAALIYAKQDQSGNSSIHDTVVDNTDGSNDCCNAMSAWVEYNDYISGMDNAVFGEIGQFHDSVITNMVAPSNGVHGNCIHLFGSNAVNELIYNNYIRCLNTGTPDEMFLVEENSATVYAFNNVLVMDGHGTMFELANNGSGGGTYTFFRNTAECGIDASPSGHCFVWKNGTETVTGNHNFFITSGSLISAAGATWSASFTPAAAGGIRINAPVGAGNGTGNLNLTQTYPFAPLDATALATVGNSANDSAICTTISGINAAAGTACGLDTTLGVSYNSSNHTVTFPARTAITRGGGNWENGAYEQAGALIPSCSPGSGSSSTSITVTCTNSNGGTTVMCYTTDGSLPVTNGSGTACTNGTIVTTTITINATVSTLKVVAGTSLLPDSGASIYGAYVISGGSNSGTTVSGGFTWSNGVVIK